MTPDERREEIVRRLSAGAQGVTLGALADELGVVMLTVERDLENLRGQGYQIESQRGRSGGIQMTAAPSSSSNIAPAGNSRSPRAFGRPFVGRSAQMSELREALALASSGSGGVSLVSGDRGIGKTARSRNLLDSRKPPVSKSTGHAARKIAALPLTGPGPRSFGPSWPAMTTHF